MAGREPVAQRARAVLDTHQGAPSAAQLAAGNYPKRRLRFAGLDVTVETEAGCVRSGVDGAGRRWERRMPFAYGYLRGSLGTDGDHVDCFLGPSEEAPVAWVVRAMRYGRWSEPDEDKVMLGFDSEDDARRAFSLAYDDPRFMGEVFAVPVAELPARLQALRGRFMKGLPALFVLRGLSRRVGR